MKENNIIKCHWLIYEMDPCILTHFGMAPSTFLKFCLVQWIEASVLNILDKHPTTELPP